MEKHYSKFSTDELFITTLHSELINFSNLESSVKSDFPEMTNSFRFSIVLIDNGNSAISSSNIYKYLSGLNLEILSDIFLILFPPIYNSLSLIRLNRVSGKFFTLLFTMDNVSRFGKDEKSRLRSSPLTSIPDGLSNFQELRSLRLINNQLTDLPDELCELHNLEELIITNAWRTAENQKKRGQLRPSPLQSLPDNLHKLKKLKRLTLGNMDLQILPDAIFEMSKLEILELHMLPMVRLIQI